jgi:hypothetical protein
LRAFARWAKPLDLIHEEAFSLAPQAFERDPDIRWGAVTGFLGFATQPVDIGSGPRRTLKQPRNKWILKALP